MAVGTAADNQPSADRPASGHHGTRMNPPSPNVAPRGGSDAAPFHLDSRWLGPILITCILVAAHLSFGVLEGYTRTGLAILVAVAAEMILGRLTIGRFPNLSSAYITGISVGILVRSPFLWPYAIGSFVSILSKYVLRM